MTLDEFEKSLVEEEQARDAGESTDIQSESRKRRKKNHHHHHHYHRHRRDENEDSHGRRRSGRLEHSKHSLRNETEYEIRKGYGDAHECEGVHEWVEKGVATTNESAVKSQDRPDAPGELKRDAWMEDPSAISIDYIHRPIKEDPKLTITTPSKADFGLKIHDNELNKHHLQDLADGKDVSDDVVQEPAPHTVDYVFGDSGSQWRMTKLKAVHRRARESGADVDDVAIEQYGDLRSFDDAREEETELERRETYGDGYVGKEKPSGELFQQRKLEMGVRNDKNFGPSETEEQAQPRVIDTEPAPQTTKLIDQTTLNRLKAQMMKARLKGSSDASRLEAEYNEALGFFAGSPKPGTVVLGAMDNRMLAGGQRGEIKAVDTKRGRDQGLVGENEDMSIEDMVREERRTRNQLGGDGQRFAERIAKDAKFDVSLQVSSWESIC